MTKVQVSLAEVPGHEGNMEVMFTWGIAHFKTYFN
jgi:hypothetical protein